MHSPAAVKSWLRLRPQKPKQNTHRMLQLLLDWGENDEMRRKKDGTPRVKRRPASSRAYEGERIPQCPEGLEGYCVS
jgi:hypothetical protein